MKRKLYLIDGMSHLYRAYYAIRGLTSRQGRPTNAVYGFTNMLRKLILEEKPEYLGVAVDLRGPTIRHEQFEGYKATRRPMPDDLKQQVPAVLDVCRVLRVPVISLEGFEADDVIGALSKKAVDEGLEVVIVTIDKDLFQLVTPHVTILDTRTMLRLDPAGVEKKFGVKPHQVADVLALVGDSSDNIPGAPGIGQKGACQLIRKFGDLETLLEERESVKRKTYRESLQQNEEVIRVSRQLVQIHQDVEVELNLQELRLSEPDVLAARELFTELDFVSLLEEFLPSSSERQVEYRALQSPAEIEEFAARCQDRPVAFAVKGSWEGDEEILIGVAAEKGKGFWFGPQLAPEAGAWLQRIADASSSCAVHDLKKLYFHCRRKEWKVPEGLFDTMLMAYLVSPNHNDFSLGRLALEYLQLKMDEVEQPGLFERPQGESVAEAAELTQQLLEVLQPEVDSRGLQPLLNDIELPLVRILAGMEETGVRVDCDFLDRMSAQMEGEIERLRERIHELAGEEFNLNSPKQLAEVLFEKLALPSPKKTRKAGHYSTGVDVLQALATDHEIARLLLEYRELSKLKSTYLDALPRMADKQGRIHTSYNNMVAATGRLSSSNPNLQNIPIKSDLGREIRRAFVADEGFQILAADYSQIELRVMAHLSRDPVLVDAFAKGEDIHERTAKEVFGMRAMLEPREFRRHAKVINFGIMYGLSAYGLAQSLDISRKEAQSFIDDYFARYQGVKEWIDHTLAQTRETGYVTTLFGRIRQIPEIFSKNWNLRGFGERTAINAPIQGTAADLIKKAMVDIDRQLLKTGSISRMILQVHDELVFEVADSEVSSFQEMVRERMEQVADLIVPLKVDICIGRNWFEAK